MKFYSTRGSVENKVDLKTALLRGLAPDGGLYLPEEIPHLTESMFQNLRDLSFADLANDIAQRWFATDLAPEQIEEIVAEAYANFSVPVIEMKPGQYVCELFHGPSLSFKDFAAQFLLRLLDALLEQNNERALILTATSGDTGSAVAMAAHGRKRIDAVVLYPKGKISEVQERQITTVGGNVHAVAVSGSFDDCQRLVKAVLIDGEWNGRNLTSANSINVGRLLPQTFYYWAASLAAARESGERVIFVVPSGNLGNLTAGVMAKRMGAPIAGFVAANNINDAFSSYLADGIYNPQPTKQTISNAMDVGSPSNFERLRYLYSDKVSAMRKDIASYVVNDAETREVMASVFNQNDYLLDPHSAVAWGALLRHKSSRKGEKQKPMITLSTAHPAKFSEIVAEATGQTPEMPARLEAVLNKPSKSVELEETAESSLRQLLTKLFK